MVDGESGRAAAKEAWGDRQGQTLVVEDTLTALGEMGAQVFITCIEQKDVLATWPEAGAHRAMFHVEHGAIRREET